MKSLLVLAALLSVAFAYSALEYQQAFTAWMQQHDKLYTTEDFQARFAAFRDNMDYVRDWNNGNSETTLGLNIMADLTNAEYRRIYLGTRIDATQRVPSGEVGKYSASSLLDSVDWRPLGAVTPIKDQGQCGSCWAFSAVGSTEAAHFFATKNLVSLSEQNLVDCSGKFGNNGCNGGYMDDAFKYIIHNKGIDTEASYPYKAVEGKCAFKAADIGATLSNYTDVASKDEDALAAAVVITPVSVAIDASHKTFQLYKTGIYYESDCSQDALDHGVLAVGYGNGFWIVKNSWGTSWGEQGYIQMSRGRNNNCGIATMASYPTA